MYNDAIGFISSPDFLYTSVGKCTYSIERSGQDSVAIIFVVFYLHRGYSMYGGYSYSCSDAEDWVEVSKR